MFESGWGRWVVLLGLVVGLVGSARAGEEPRIRVLLFQSDAPVEVFEAGRRVRVSLDGDRLRVDGGAPGRVWRSTGSPVRVRELALRGAVEVLPHEGRLAVVNELPVEDYLLGTLGLEVYASWSPEALRAQAVASRTYAVHRMALQRMDVSRRARRPRPWDLGAGTASQVYGGLRAESEPVRAAVRVTQGQILTFEGAPILAVFHSASGGRTASSQEVWGDARPYLQSAPVEDEWESPDTYWRVLLSRTTLRRAAEALGHDIGAVRDAMVLSRSESGRVERVRLTGESGTAILDGRALRRAVGESVLKSTLFELKRDGDGFRVVGSGNGHGVGMSQWGARAMAEAGSDYRQILQAFYPGTRLERVSSAAASAADGPPPVASGGGIPDLHERVADVPLAALPLSADAEAGP